jgi:hypothetical protein
LKSSRNVVPIAVALPTITIEIRLAITAYSMTVVPQELTAKTFTKDRAAWE